MTVWRGKVTRGDARSRKDKLGDARRSEETRGEARRREETRGDARRREETRGEETRGDARSNTIWRKKEINKKKTRDFDVQRIYKRDEKYQKKKTK